MSTCNRLLWNIHQKRMRCDWSNADEEDVLAKTIAMDCIVQQQTFNFPLCYFQPTLTHKELLALLAPGMNPIPQKKSVSNFATKEKKRITVGYFSADFRCHSGGAPFWKLIRRHDRKKIKTVGISIAPASYRQTLRHEIENCFEYFLEFSESESDDYIAESLKNLNLDILIDTTRHIGESRPGILANHPACKIISAWGYGGTTGSPYVEFILADEILIRNDEEIYYSEQVIKIPSYHPVTPVSVLPKSRGRLHENLPLDAFVFANFNAHYKLSPTLFRLWMELLKSVPDSVLWLGEGTGEGRSNLRKEAEMSGIRPARLVFAPRTEREAHITRLRLADLVLDNPRMGGGASVSDALQAGTPAISWIGSSIHERSGASILTSAGFEKSVAESPEEYLVMAQELALNNLTILNEVRSQIGFRVAQNGLLDMHAYLRNLEKLYFNIVK